ncbi:MAG: hypothetical protein AAF901_08745 [Bacteroidota bacterium]
MRLNKIKVFKLIIAFIIVTYFFSDWENFKAGLLGKPPFIEATEKE